jgi:hypothetical protein
MSGIIVSKIMDNKKRVSSGGNMKQLRIILPILMVIITTSLFASQMWVVGEVFTETW